MTPILTRKAFAAWLSQREPDQVVGTALSSSMCPLAQFLTATAPARYTDIHVYPDEITWHNGRYYSGRNTSFWAERFVRRVDRLHSQTDHSSVTARQCQEILASKEKEDEEE